MNDWKTMNGWKICLFLIFGGTTILNVRAAEPSPFADARAVWHMGDLDDASPNGIPLVAHGEVRVGVDLPETERDASLASGGDGKVAELSGGYFSIPPEHEEHLDLTGMEMTLLVRLRDPAGAWDAPLAGKFGGEGSVSYFLEGVDGMDKPREVTNVKGSELNTIYHQIFDDQPDRRYIEGSRQLIEFTWGGSPPEEAVTRLKTNHLRHPLVIEELDHGIQKVAMPI